MGLAAQQLAVEGIAACLTASIAICWACTAVSALALSKGQSAPAPCLLCFCSAMAYQGMALALHLAVLPSLGLLSSHCHPASC